MQKKASTLVPLILVIVIIGIIVHSTVKFIWESTRYNLMLAHKTQAAMAAQAGMMRAAYLALRDSQYTTEAETQLTGKQYHLYSFAGSGGGTVDASFEVYVDATSSNNTANNRNILGWKIVNQDAVNGHTIDRIQVSWSGSGTRTLSRIYINGVRNPSSGGPWSSGTSINISDTLIGAGVTLPTGSNNNELRFNNNMTGWTVNINLLFTDGSSTGYKKVFSATAPTPPTPPSTAPTTIISTGEVKSGSTIIMKKTISASFEVSGTNLKIKKYSEN